MQHHSVSLVVSACMLSVAAGCSVSDDDGPYLEIVGGGFVFNYRQATAEYGFVAKPLRRLPPGTVIEAEFEDPAGGLPIIVRQTAKAGRLQYVFRTPPLQGVRADKHYQVTLRLLGATDGEVLATYARAFRSDVDQSVLSAKPPVVGPGYRRNPKADD